jgi:outer membrane protein
LIEIGIVSDLTKMKGILENMNQVRVLIWISALALASVTTSTASARALSWSESLKLALENNTELKAAGDAFRSTEDQEGVARGGFLPTVSGSLTGTRSGTAGSLDYGTAPGNQFSATLKGGENLFSGLYDHGNLVRAKANTRAALAVLQIARAKMSFDLKSAYEGLRFAQNARSLSLEIVKRRESNLGLVQLRFNSGRENKGTVLLSKAYLADAKYGALQADHSTSAARATLARVVGLDDTDETLNASEEVPTHEPPAAPDFRKVATVTPDHIQAAAQEDAAEAAVTVARAGFFPTLDLSGTYGRRDTVFFPNGPDRWSLGLTLTIPIFNGGKDYYSTKGVNATYAGSIENRVGVDRGLLVSLRQAFHGYIEAVAKADVDASYRDAAQLRAEIARTQYNNGLVSFADWDLIENDLIAREKAYLQSSRERVTAEATWEQAQGTGVVP